MITLPRESLDLKRAIVWGDCKRPFRYWFARPNLTEYTNKCEYLYIPMPEIANFTAEFFKALGHPMRVKILETLRKDEVGVNELSARLGVEQATLSQQLAVLRKSNIVSGRKEGQNVYYSVRDPEIFRLLDSARKIFNNHLIDVRDLLAQLNPVIRK